MGETDRSGPRFDLATFGEMLVRLSVPSGQRLEHASHFDVHPAGAEANVSTLLARLDRRTLWAGALPDNPLGRLACHALRSAGVDPSGVLWREQGRMGTYYVEFGELPRGIDVLYDRRFSCTTELQPRDIDWDLLLDTRLLHLTGITPALSPSCREIVQEALQRAHARGVPVSFDVNYRHKLWTEEDAARTLRPLIRGAEILFCSRADAARLFGCTGPPEEAARKLQDVSEARSLIMSLADEGALLAQKDTCWHEPARPTRVIDRLGAGDALAAGVIHGWLEGDIRSGLRYGTLLAGLALSQHGDMVITSRSELLRLSRGPSDLTR